MRGLTKVAVGAAVLAAALVRAAAPAGAGPGAAVPTWGTQGVRTLDGGGQQQLRPWVTTLAVGPGDALYVGGSVSVIVDEGLLQRRTAQGALDSTFSTATAFDGTRELVYASSVGVDGSVTTASVGRGSVRRFDASGNQVASFPIENYLGSYDRGVVWSDSAGRFLVQRNGISRYSATGVLDTTFGQGGSLPAGHAWRSATGRLLRCNGSTVSANLDDGTTDLGFGGTGTIDVPCSFITGRGEVAYAIADGKARRISRTGAIDSTYGGAGAANVGQAENAVVDSAGRLTMLAGQNASPQPLSLRRLAADGTPETGYGSNGTLVLTGFTRTGFATSMVVDSADRITLADGRDALRRVLPDGALDPTLAQTVPVTTRSTDQLLDTAGLADGSTLVLRHSKDTADRLVVTKVSKDGLVSSGYGGGTGSVEVVQVAPTDRAVLASDSSGRAWVASQSGTHTEVRRLTPIGTTDPAFHGGQPLTLAQGPPVGAAVDDLGRLVLLLGTTGDQHLVRVGPDSQDLGFGGGDIVVPSSCSPDSADLEVEFRSTACDGIVLVDAQKRVLVVPANGSVRRYLASGAPDPGWTPKASSSGVKDVALLPDGGIVVINQVVYGGAVHHIIYRLRSEGSVDEAYTERASAASPVFAGDTAFGVAIALQPDGRLVITGRDPATSVRLTMNGDRDPSWTPSQGFTAGLVGEVTRRTSLTRGASGHLVFATTIDQPGTVGRDRDVALVQLDGSPAPEATSASLVSTDQYTLTGSDGTTWQPIDVTKLRGTLTVPTASTALLTGNADLWTWVDGINQDVGIFVDGTLRAWKESGGYGGTFSPNAAAVQAVVPLTAGDHVIELRWKANKATTGRISAGAGPIGGRFSPTSLAATVVPTASSTSVQSATSTVQHALAATTPDTWTPLPGTSITIDRPTASTALLRGNADLWTDRSDASQDLAIFVDGQLSTWKESGGRAGTFSPNAATVEALVPLTAGPHTVDLRWKPNQAVAGATIRAGAGPIDGAFSPTTLTALVLPPTANVQTSTASVSTQPALTGSDGTTWQPLPQPVQVTTAAPVATVALLTANADLWTETAGRNQDLAIFVDGQLVTWKESGGVGATYSPNAAFAQAVVLLPPGPHLVELRWKANTAASGTIHLGAGPVQSAYSPTRLTAILTPA